MKKESAANPPPPRPRSGTPLGRPLGTTQKLADRKLKTKTDLFQDFDGTRPPGWRPDTAGTPTTPEFYFVEEAIKKNAVLGGWQHFPPPKVPGYPGFREPGTRDATNTVIVPDTQQNWISYNSWILGYPLSPPTDPKDTFGNYLNHLAQLVREYNAALYWLRRLHYTANAPAGSAIFPRNPHGDKDDPSSADDTVPAQPLKTHPMFDTFVTNAQAEWKRVVRDINLKLEAPGLGDIYVDMVEANGYIVSMRVICTPAISFVELVGSSSSHISISSAFSST